MMRMVLKYVHYVNEIESVGLLAGQSACGSIDAYLSLIDQPHTL